MIDILPFKLELKAVRDDGTWEGYAAVFSTVDRVGDICEPGCFAETLKEWKASGAFPPHVWFHDLSRPVGELTAAEEDKNGLYTAGRLWVDPTPAAVPDAVMVHRGMKAKNCLDMSFGFEKKAFDFDANGVRHLHAVHIAEVSSAPTGAGVNRLAKVLSVKALYQRGDVPQVRYLEEILRDGGLSEREAKALLAEGYRAIAPRDAGTPAAPAELNTASLTVWR